MEIEGVYAEMVERIETIRKMKGFANAENLAVGIGMKPRTLQHQFSKSKLSLEFLLRLMTTYPSLNAEWILKGVGNMEETPKLYTNAELMTALVTTNRVLTKYLEEGMDGQSDTGEGKAVKDNA